MVSELDTSAVLDYSLEIQRRARPLRTHRPNSLSSSCAIEAQSCALPPGWPAADTDLRRMFAQEPALQFGERNVGLLGHARPQGLLKGSELLRRSAARRAGGRLARRATAPERLVYVRNAHTKQRRRRIRLAPS